MDKIEYEGKTYERRKHKWSDKKEDICSFTAFRS